MDLRPQTQTSIAVAADVFTLLAMSAPLWTAMPAIADKGTVGRRSPLPNIAACLACCVGMLNGCAHHDGLAVAVGTVGGIFQAVYVHFFIRHSPARRLVHLQCLVPALAYLLVGILYLVGAADADTLAVIAGACGCLVPASIAYNLGKVKSDRSMECMPHPIVPALSLVSAPLWILYAFAGKDSKYYVALPNCLGMVFAAIQLYLHFRFWFPRYKTDKALREWLLERPDVDC